MSETKALWTPMAESELRENGWDPVWVQEDADREGPFAAVHVFDQNCPTCGGNVDGWTVLNLETGTGHSTTWHHSEAECEAAEKAGMLNQAWLAGYHSGAAR
jgi:hypothetical protein